MFRGFFSCLFFLTALAPQAVACSMCKVTVGGRTYVGSNEDSWQTASRIWFEAPRPGALGAVYVGYGDNRFPQGGMNEAGLTFDGLTILPVHPKPVPGRKPLHDAGGFLKAILQTCRTVDEVAAFANGYNRGGVLDRGIAFFADRTGRYLVLQPDTVLLGADAHYLIANFCPSRTTPDEARQQFGRYARGQAFLDQHAAAPGAGFGYCRALTDTMHECRPKLGDGTLYSTLADLDGGTYTLYFYHDFSRPVTFHLDQELAKGDHGYSLPALFPASAEYNRLVAFKTPFNNRMVAMLCGSCLLLCAAAVPALGVGLVRNEIRRRRSARTAVYAGTLLACAAVLYYGYLLLTHQAIFYFPAPYRAPGEPVATAFGYLPVALLIGVPVLAWRGVQTARLGTWRSNAVLGLAGLALLALLGLFAYWGLLAV